jgi:hypothetical protein
MRAINPPENLWRKRADRKTAKDHSDQTAENSPSEVGKAVIGTSPFFLTIFDLNVS